MDDYQRQLECQVASAVQQAEEIKRDAGDQSFAYGVYMGELNGLALALRLYAEAEYVGVMFDDKWAAEILAKGVVLRQPRIHGPKA